MQTQQVIDATREKSLTDRRDAINSGKLPYIRSDDTDAFLKNLDAIAAGTMAVLPPLTKDTSPGQRKALDHSEFLANLSDIASGKMQVAVG